MDDNHCYYDDDDYDHRSLTDDADADDDYCPMAVMTDLYNCCYSDHNYCYCCYC